MQTLRPEDDPFTKVHLASDSKSTPQLHPFYECTLSHFGHNHDHSMRVHLDLDLKENRIVLRPADPSDKNSLHLEHATRCPVRALGSRSDLHQAHSQSFVRIGVAVVVENENDEVLITRRPEHMRTFPLTWVIPGGHIEVGETFEQAGVRELEEETGLRVSVNDVSILLLYESVFPVLLEEGNPSRHHIVVYLKAKVHSNKVELKLSHDEVGACSWASKDVIREALKSEPSTAAEQFSFQGIEAILGEWKEKTFHIKQLQSIPDENNRLPKERLSTGSRVALREWLRTKL